MALHDFYGLAGDTFDLHVHGVVQQGVRQVLHCQAEGG